MAFTGKTALITGAAMGIGRSTALALAAAGARVLVTDIDAAGAEAVAAEIRREGGQAEGLACDVGSDGSVRALHDTVVARFGAPDLLINNAYGRAFSRTSIDAPDYDLWRRAFDINVLGNIRMISAFLPELQAKGGCHIVDTSSSLSIAPNPDAQGSLPYISTKGAILGMGYGLAGIMRDRGIRYSIFCPGKTATGPRALEPNDLPGPDYAAKVLLAGIEAGDYLISSEPDFERVLVRLAQNKLDPLSNFR